MKIIADMGRHASLLGDIITNLHEIQTALYTRAEIDEVTKYPEFLLYHIEDEDHFILITIHIGMEGTSAVLSDNHFRIENQLFFRNGAFQFRILSEDQFVDLINHDRVDQKTLVANMVKRFKELVPFHTEAASMGKAKTA